jgi:cytochrome d ubiquinol oxidase subunit II
MIEVHTFLSALWYLILGGILMVYVLTDGFDLGVGILTLFENNEHNNRSMLDTINGIWDANETWLVLFGGALFGAFPDAYALILHGLYIPVSLLIFGLILRGVGYEFSHHSDNPRLWRMVFGGGSLLAALAQGYALGAVIGGVPVVDGKFAGGILFWLNGFTTLVAAGVATGYGLLGGTWLSAHTSGRLQRSCQERSRVIAWIMLSCAGLVTLFTPVLHSYILSRWLVLPNMVWFMIPPAVALFAFVKLQRSLPGDSGYWPFIWTLVIFFASFVGLAASLYPFLVPPVLTAAAAGASSSTLVFMLIGMGILIPVMLIYNGFQYLVLRIDTISK